MEMCARHVFLNENPTFLNVKISQYQSFLCKSPPALAVTVWRPRNLLFPKYCIPTCMLIYYKIGEFTFVIFDMEKSCYCLG